MEPGRETFEIVKKLAPRSRVALGCVATEHLIDLYRLGNMKYSVKDVPDLGGAFAADRDLIELGLEMAWRFAEEGKHEASETAPIIAMLEARPHHKESATLSLAANGPIYGVIDSLKAISDETPSAGGFAVSRSRTGVFKLARELDPDEDAPAREDRMEAVWQLKVAHLIMKHGEAPIERASFRELLAEELPWRRYLPQYRAKWSGGAASAEVAQPPSKATAPGRKPKPKSGQK